MPTSAKIKINLAKVSDIESIQRLNKRYFHSTYPEIETKDEHTELAQRRVGLGLIVAELGRKNDIEVTEAEVSQAVMNQARQYPGQEKQFFDFMKSNPQMQEQIRAPIFEDKVIDFIFELVEVSEKTVKKADLEKAVKKLEES